jgi:hypothetical protein
VSVLPVSHFTWQVLRTVKRSKAAPTGKQLRVVPTRRTKDGTFLDDLMTQGLLRVVGVDEVPAKAPLPDSGAPVQFRTRYALTPLGEHAAEYGEYNREPVKPVPEARVGASRKEPRVRNRL